MPASPRSASRPPYKGLPHERAIGGLKRAMPEPPFALQLVDGRSAYVTLMAVLFALFVLRVVGQILAATIAPAWLPPMARWYSGLMPYRYLLPTQIGFLLVMTTMTIAVARRTPPLGTLSASAGAWIIWASYLYALGMIVRSVRYRLDAR